MNTNGKEVAEAIANIESTSLALEKMSHKETLSPYAADLLERLSWELHKLAGDLSEINYNYVS